MIHTAKFQITLEEGKIAFLTRKFKEKITLVGT